MILILTDGDQKYYDEDKNFDSLKELDSSKRFQW